MDSTSICLAYLCQSHVEKSDSMINLKSLREQVYEFLRQELLSGNLVPGSSINLNEISRRLGISKTPLRDALLQLEVDGFVTIAPRSGIYVNRLSLDAVRHCYEMAGALETAVILSNLKQIDDNRIARMKWLNVGLRNAIEREDFDTLYELNLAFHGVFMELSDNTTLRRIVSVAKQRLYDFPRRGYIVKWELRNCEEHDLLIDAIERADLDRIKTVWMEGHWGFSTQEKFIRQFYFPDPENGIENTEDRRQKSEYRMQNREYKIKTRR
jgi:DNA-binding GntR family transcriptional regulator